jgi:hypothetical protein
VLAYSPGECGFADSRGSCWLVACCALLASRVRLPCCCCSRPLLLPRVTCGAAALVDSHRVGDFASRHLRRNSSKIVVLCGCVSLLSREWGFAGRYSLYYLFRVCVSLLSYVRVALPALVYVSQLSCVRVASLAFFLDYPTLPCEGGCVDLVPM